jgi:hypothetical protein
MVELLNMTPTSVSNAIGEYRRSLVEPPLPDNHTHNALDCLTI